MLKNGEVKIFHWCNKVHYKGVRIIMEILVVTHHSEAPEAHFSEPITSFSLYNELFTHDKLLAWVGRRWLSRPC